MRLKDSGHYKNATGGSFSITEDQKKRAATLLLAEQTERIANAQEAEVLMKYLAMLKELRSNGHVVEDEHIQLVSRVMGVLVTEMLN